MSLPPSFLDELRQRVGLFGLVGRRVKLQRAGREMKGCCPFHNEKTPSFYVNEDKGFFHCFGCGAHGDAIGWTMQVDGLGFMDAVKQLAAETGLEVPAPSPQAAAREERAKTLHDIAQAALDWFRQQLATSSGAKARAYLDKRGIAPETRAEFAIGWAPAERQALRTALKEHTDAKLAEIGVIGRTDDGQPYDRFRARVIFPIHDSRGRPIGFGGRVLDDAQPKYLNSPDTPLFDKGRVLYNHHRAAPLARKSGQLLIAEGYLDVIALHTAGLPAVAPLGTALTQDQLDLAWRLADEPTLALDGDAAGQRAALRAAIRALPRLAPGKSLRFATLPPGQDPDDLIRAQGADAARALFATGQPLHDFLFAAERQSFDLTTPERRAAFLERLRELSATIDNYAVQRDYALSWRRAAIRLFSEDFGHGFTKRPPWQSKGFAPPPTALPETKAMLQAPNRIVEAKILVSFVHHERDLAEYDEQISRLELHYPALERLHASLAAHAEVPPVRVRGIVPLVARERAEDFHDTMTAVLGSLVRLHELRDEWRALRERYADDPDRAFAQQRALNQDAFRAKQEIYAVIERQADAAA